MIRVRNEKKGGIFDKGKVSQGELDRRRDNGREIRHPIEIEREREKIKWFWSFFGGFESSTGTVCHDPPDIQENRISCLVKLLKMTLQCLVTVNHVKQSTCL